VGHEGDELEAIREGAVTEAFTKKRLSGTRRPTSSITAKIRPGSRRAARLPR